MIDAKFRQFLVFRDQNDQVRHEIRPTQLADQPPGDVVIQVRWSSLNYKDALAAQGHPGVAGDLPHVPGIDAAGEVLTSSDVRYQAGDPVLVTGYELGAPRWGGWSEQIRVPADWVVPLPDTLSMRDAMVLGTAGFTAALCLRELELAEVTAERGPVLVTGATGGVGSFAVKLLSQRGYEVHAVSGKQHLTDELKSLGATEVHGRDLMGDNPKRPLLSARWAGGVDTVGGPPLVAFLKATQIGGCVAACGLVAGDQLGLSIYPFILRGVTLAGVTSSSCERRIREQIWRNLSADWKVAYPESWVEEVDFAGLGEAVDRIAKGKVSGRVVVRVS